MTIKLQNNYPWSDSVARILTASLEAVDPARAVREHLKRQGNQLLLPNAAYDLGDYRRFLMIGFGKACLPMAEAVIEILGKSLAKGILIPKASPDLRIPPLAPQVQVHPAGHPVPDQRGLAAAKKIIALLKTSQPDDLILILVSGGGSALLTAPVPGVSLKDLQNLNHALLACGATIQEINTLRKHLSRVKGGGLAKLAAPATTLTLILSDVIGDPLDAIASGPTVPDPTTFETAQRIVENYNLQSQLPSSILEHLQKGTRGKVPETLKGQPPSPQQIFVIGNNLRAGRAGVRAAQKEGFQAQILTTFLHGEARQVGGVLGAILRQMAEEGEPLPRPACLIAGGETTVTLGESPGLGGRNLELSLSAVEKVAHLPHVALITLATDGEDGPTDAAGAVVTGQTLARAQNLNLSPQKFLARHDAYNFFEPLGDLLTPGPTGTNVNDLNFLFTFET
ncbi:MAG: D-glycerate 2-kinase [Chloroflexi bacterium]|nr:D-glycerate 2-kinase [Chloroflexota bacterium]